MNKLATQNTHRYTEICCLSWIFVKHAYSRQQFNQHKSFWRWSPCTWSNSLGHNMTATVILFHKYTTYAIPYLYHWSIYICLFYFGGQKKSNFALYSLGVLPCHSFILHHGAFDKDCKIYLLLASLLWFHKLAVEDMMAYKGTWIDSISGNIMKLVR